MSIKKRIFLIVLCVLYVAAIVTAFINPKLSLVLWAASLLPSLIFYLNQKHLEQLALEKELALKEQEEQLNTENNDESAN